jgi:hypothetical protein
MYGKIGVSLAAVLLILVGAAPAVRAGPAKACDLMTQQTAAAITGRPVEAGIERPGPTLACEFHVLDAGGFVSIGVLDPSSMRMNPAAMFQMAVKDNQGKPGVGVETISGLGEDAFLIDSYPDTAVADISLYILYHGKILVLDLNGNSQNAGRKSAMIQAAKQAVSQM